MMASGRRPVLDAAQEPKKTQQKSDETATGRQKDVAVNMLSGKLSGKLSASNVDMFNGMMG
jgi:hypothetical protein